MQKFKYLSLILMYNTLLASSAMADVRFIIGINEDANTIDGAERVNDLRTACALKGFGVEASDCTGVKNPGLLCPLSPLYTDRCCPIEYAYVLPGSCPFGTVAKENDTCGGRYRCICDPYTYPKGVGPGREKCEGMFDYDDTNRCAEVSYAEDGSKTTTYYFKGCTCSGSFARCNTTYHLRGLGEPCSYDGHVYYKTCACEPGYNKLCSTSGAKDASDYCYFNHKKYYKACNSDEADSKSDDDAMNSTEQ